MTSSGGVGQPTFRAVAVLVGIAIAVSIVHYVDNFTAYEAYPQSDTLPNPSASLIAAGWFVLTPFAILGLVLLGDGRTRAAGISLAVYSGSGLVGIGHYAAGGTGDFPWWRHAHIAADIALGVAILAVAAWLATRAPSRPAQG